MDLSGLLSSPFLGFLVLAHVLGLATSFLALMRTRTPQGTVAWIVSLNTLPWIAVPVWWLFGKSHVESYARLREGHHARLKAVLDQAREASCAFRTGYPERPHGFRTVGGLTRMPLTGRNAVEVLVDGESTFESLFRGMEEAKKVLLVQFYIIRDDSLGARLQEILIRKANEGVRVCLLYDGAGSFRLGETWLQELRENGVQVAGFKLKRGIRLRSLLNFRNHRKITVVDGKVGWTGGLNAGEEYLGLNPDRGPWRDTHVRIEGPAVLALQAAFLEDWCWATGEVLELDWTPRPAADVADVATLLVPTGPGDTLETGSLLIQHAIHSAERRVWIATPYFIPDGAVMSALHLAHLRGVDVRLLVARRPDSLAVHLAAFTYFEPLLKAGIRIYQYDAGFLHSKIFLVDEGTAGVGTMNIDNRSFRLNFEITAVLVDRSIVEHVESIFREDFERSSELTEGVILEQPGWFRVLCRTARILSPVL